MTKTSALSVLFIVIMMGCGTHEKQYAIINEQKMGNIKSTIDVRLKSEVDKDSLAEIATELKNNGRNNYERIFINYYLPGMEIGKGAWATSHFNPKLNVKVMALTKEEKKQLLPDTTSAEDNFIGRWLDNSPYVGGVYAISKEGNTMKLSVKFKDGSGRLKKLTEKVVNGQKRWYEEDNDLDKYYVLNDNGSLSIFDKEGLIKTLPKVK